MKNFTPLLLLFCSLFIYDVGYAQCNGADITDCEMTTAADLVAPDVASCQRTGDCGGLVTEYFVVDLNNIVTTDDDPATPEDEFTSGPLIVGSSISGIITPSDFGFADGDCFAMIPVCYDLQAVKTLIDDMNTAPTNNCCTIVDQQANGACTTLRNLGYDSGDQINNIDDVLGVLSAFGNTQVSVDYFVYITETINSEFDPLLGLDFFCTNSGPIAFCTDQLVRTEFSVIACPLGIELANFEATNTQLGNELKWTTESEFDNDYFIVERSHDGTTYEAIGMVEAIGNSTSAINYNFNDDKVVGRINYYRIVAVSYSEDKEVSNVVAVETNSLTTLDAINIAPNPIRSAINISFDSDINGSANIMIVDATGKTVLDDTIDVVLGYNQLEEQLGHLNTGLYMAVIQIGDNVASEKFMKL